MAKIPIDVKAVLEEALHVSEASKEPVAVGVFLDDSAPNDLVAHVRNAFASAAVHARITISYLGPSQAPVLPTDDLTVVVAGSNPGVGAFAAQARNAGVPTMVVTTSPVQVARIAENAGNPIPEGDVVAPVELSLSSSPAARAVKAAEGDAAPQAEQAGAPQQQEPIELGKQEAALLDTRMGQWVIATCQEKKLSLALAFPFVRKPLSLEAVNVTAVQNAGIGLVVFIPGADMPVMTLNQAKMLLQIAAAYGQPMNAERAKELAAVVAGAFAFRTVARQACAFAPVVGWVAKAAIGYTGTLAMGRAAVEYFEDGGGAAGLAGMVGKARDAAVRAASAARGQAAPEPEQPKTAQEAMRDTAQVWGERAGKAARAAGKAAVPLAKEAVKAGGASFVAGLGAMVPGFKSKN